MKLNSKPTPIVLVIIFIMISTFVRADIKLPSIFNDHMVLQQHTETSIWGKASLNEKVQVKCSWEDRTYITNSDKNGDWAIKIKTPTAGGPYTITISDGKEFQLNDILIGEVWLCSGQSNMWMHMLGYRNQPVLGSNHAIATSQNQYIRLITVEKDKSLTPKDDFNGEWLECSPENVAVFSATAYYFAKLLQKSLNVPIGVISSSWGGTRIEPWISENGIKIFDWIQRPENYPKEFTQQAPTVLYNAMIKPMIPYAIKGAIWYQGESNKEEPDKYLKLLPGLVDSWRKAWNIGDFPFYYAQIAPFAYRGGINSAFLRESQLNAEKALPNMGMATLMDAGEENNIHPANKELAGERLAFLALNQTYGISGISSSGPTLKGMVVEGKLIHLTFNNAEKGLTSFGKELSHFTVANENRKFQPAKAYITNKGITLVVPDMDKPVAVRYAFDDFVVGDLYNTAGLPASSFRTDDWAD